MDHLTMQQGWFILKSNCLVLPFNNRYHVSIHIKVQHITCTGTYVYTSTILPPSDLQLYKFQREV